MITNFHPLDILLIALRVENATNSDKVWHRWINRTVDRHYGFVIIPGNYTKCKLKYTNAFYNLIKLRCLPSVWINAQFYSWNQCESKLSGEVELYRLLLSRLIYNYMQNSRNRATIFHTKLLISLF